MPITKRRIEAVFGLPGHKSMPEDFDVFWDARVEEARQVPLKYHLSASEIPDFDTCRFMDLEFTGIRGEQLYAKYLLPVSSKPVPLVLQFHGYPGASRRLAGTGILCRYGLCAAGDGLPWSGRPGTGCWRLQRVLR